MLVIFFLKVRIIFPSFPLFFQFKMIIDFAEQWLYILLLQKKIAVFVNMTYNFLF